MQVLYGAASRKVRTQLAILWLCVYDPRPFPREDPRIRTLHKMNDILFDASIIRSCEQKGARGNVETDAGTHLHTYDYGAVLLLMVMH